MTVADGAPQPEQAGSALGRSAVRGALWLAVSKGCSTVATLVSTAILARLLAPQDFGLVAACFSMLSLPMAIYEGAFGLALISKGSLSADDIRVSYWISIGLSSALGLTMAASAPLIAALFGFPDLTPMLLVVALTLPLRGAAAVCAALMQIHGRFNHLGGIWAASSVVNGILVAPPLALAGFGAWSLIAATAVAAMFEFVALHLAARPPMAVPKSWAGARAFGGRGGMHTLTLIANWAAMASPNFLIGSNAGAASLGLFSRGWRLMDIAMSFTAAPMQRTLIPTFSKLRHERKRAGAGVLKAVSLALPLFLVVSGLLATQVELVIVVLLGPAWLAAAPSAQVLMLAFASRSLQKILESVYLGFDMSGRAFLSQAFFFVSIVVGVSIGLGHGLTGAAAGFVAASWVYVLVVLAQVCAILQIRVVALARELARALILAGAVVGPGALVLLLGQDHGLWARHLAAGAASGVAAALLAFLPNAALGEAWAEVRGRGAAFAAKRLRRSRGFSL